MDPYWTPSTVNWNRQFGGNLFQQGTDASPVGHWTQALARVLQGGMGGYMSGQANRAEAAGKQGVADIYRQGLERGDGMNKIAAALMGNPWGADQGQQLATKYMLKTAESTGPLAQAKLDQIKAHSDLQRAQAQFWRQRGSALMRPEAPAPAAAPAPDPLAGAGLDENGVIVGGGDAPARGSQWPSANDAGAAVFGRNEPPGMMRLGGPIDDIDRSMMPDEGRSRSFSPPVALGRPQGGVRVAQAGGNYGVGAGYGGPSIVDQARSRAFGPAGVTASQVPGVVTTTGQNQRSDAFATRAAEGQRAVESATPEQQQRLLQIRQDQQRWTAVLGPPRAGYYYSPSGQELPKSERNFKGDAEQQKVIQFQLKAIDNALEKFKAMSGNPLAFAQRSLGGALNVGEIGQAFADAELAATGPAYALSGKQVTVQEMLRFARVFQPLPADDISRIEMKLGRLKNFYKALETKKNQLGPGDNLDPSHVAEAFASTQTPRQNGGATTVPRAANAPRDNGWSIQRID